MEESVKDKIEKIATQSREWAGNGGGLPFYTKDWLEGHTVGIYEGFGLAKHALRSRGLLTPEMNRILGGI
jgi:hypothetical protein